MTGGRCHRDGSRRTYPLYLFKSREEYLDDIIQRINDVFGIGLTEEDRIVIDQYEEMFKADQNIMDIAKANSYEDLVSTFGKNYFKRGIVRAKNRNDRL